MLAIVLTAPSLAAAQTTHQQHSTDQNAPSLFTGRDASGTAWQPDETPTYGVHRTWGDWQVMLHGNLFAQFVYEPGDIHRTGGFSTHQSTAATGAWRWRGDLWATDSSGCAQC